MMQFSHSGGFGGGPIALIGLLHAVGAFAFLLGILFLLFWAFKRLSESQLMSWGIGLTVGGLVVAILTMAGLSQGGFGWRNAQYGMMQNYGDDDLNVTATTGDADGGMMGGYRMRGGMMNQDDSSMTMDDMVAALDGKTGDDFDQTFLETMIPHHQGAIDMANLVLKSAKHDELKALARNIISAQQKEIDQMTAWEKSWGYAK